jgi:hypothetical protein
MTFVDPRFVPTFNQWADYMYPTLDRYGSIEQVTHGSDWKSWASGLLSLNGISQLGVPSPYQFDDWREWATRLIGALDRGE